MEIGGGTGVLTQALAEAEAEVVSIERDPLLAAQLETRFGEHGRVEIVRGDAAGYEWPARPFTVLANLPFAGSGAILAHLLGNPRTPLRRAHVIVQWQLAAKHAAVWPSTLRSTYWRAWYDLSIGRRLARTAFAPPPGVDGAVLRLERRARPRVPLESHAGFWRFLAAAFAGREPIRRALSPSLSPRQVKRLAPALGFAVDACAWDLDAEQWARLYAASRYELDSASRTKRRTSSR